MNFFFLATWVVGESQFAKISNSKVFDVSVEAGAEY